MMSCWLLSKKYRSCCMVQTALPIRRSSRAGDHHQGVRTCSPRKQNFQEAGRKDASGRQGILCQLGRRGKRGCHQAGLKSRFSARAAKGAALTSSTAVQIPLPATGQERFHNYFFPFTEGFDYAVAKVGTRKGGRYDLCHRFESDESVEPLDREFVKEVEKLCREKDMLLIIRMRETDDS